MTVWAIRKTFRRMIMSFSEYFTKYIQINTMDLANSSLPDDILAKQVAFNPNKWFRETLMLFVDCNQLNLGTLQI